MLPKGRIPPAKCMIKLHPETSSFQGELIIRDLFFVLQMKLNQWVYWP